MATAASLPRLLRLNWFRTASRAWSAVYSRPLARELVIFAGFILLTALMTWPWVLHLRNAVADPGDPYMIAWTLWWDYHQTFHDPLHLFHANVFYPYQYTLAFSENDYGIALLFFPLFAVGLRPLTVHAIATFLGFAFSGYGAFRLTRTLTRSYAAAWVAGVFFAFVPFRFHVLSHLHYLFAGWLPLLLEALVLFVRARGWRRAIWLGAAFVMNTLTCISWFIMSAIPLMLTALFLIARRPDLRRDRGLWIRGAIVMAVAAIVLTPFMIPYYKVTTLYGFKWLPWEYAYNSPSLVHWLAAEHRNRVWANLGANFPGGHKLFPGIVAPLLMLAAFRLRTWKRSSLSGNTWRKANVVLSVTAFAAALFALVTFGYGDIHFKFLRLNAFLKADRAPYHAISLAVTIIIFWIVAPYWAALRNRTAAVVGLIWLVWGFVSSLGGTLYFNLLLHDYFPLFRSLRLPSRWAMICYVGLALLAGVGAQRLVSYARRWRINPAAMMLALVAILAFELHASPLDYVPGAVDSDALARRLKETPMRGGLVELPSDQGVERHRYMLRSADHERPLVNATASFISPLTVQINNATRDQAPGPDFLDLLEKIPASYLVIHNAALLPDQRGEYENFLAVAVARQRLRFINRFDGRDDLYAVVKNEPESRSETPLPFDPSVVEWAELIKKDPVNLAGQYLAWSQRLYRLYLVATGEMPRYEPFLNEARRLSSGIFAGDEDQFRERERQLAQQLVRDKLSELADSDYVDQLIGNAHLSIDKAEREKLKDDLKSTSQTRTDLLLKLANDPRLLENEKERSLVLIDFFAYLRRNPGDPPDKDMSGFEFWVGEARKHDRAVLATAFAQSGERQDIMRR